ncbi:MAG: hypothetical protein KIS85_04765 [Anaerolineales bacterium]|nr:hypothetical protein [Anaerolineales bacterium]
MSTLPQPHDLVLVAFLPDPRDLEIARLLGWYRIPLRTAPRVVAVDWLAFYQPGSFPEGQRWQVQYCAAVQGHELVTREQLFKDEAGGPKAGHEYFKISLGPLHALPQAIPAGTWKRLTFLYTTGDRLLAAAHLGDLGVHDEERQVLFQALRERAKEKQQYSAVHQPEFPFDPELLAYISMQGGGSAYFRESGS